MLIALSLAPGSHFINTDVKQEACQSQGGLPLVDGEPWFRSWASVFHSLRGVPLPPDQCDRLPDRLVIGTVDAALDGERAVVADLFEGAEAGTEIEMAAPGLQAVAVGDVDVDEVLPIGADAGGDVDLFDPHVEEVRHDTDLGADLRRDRRSLLNAVDDVDLVAIQRLEKQGDAGGLCSGSQLAQLRQEETALQLGASGARSGNAGARPN